MNTFGSVLLTETQMVTTRYVMLRCQLWTSLIDPSQQFKRFIPQTPGAYWSLGKTHMQCNGFQPEWTNYDNCISSIRDFVQELLLSIFNSPPITMYHSIHCLNTNWFGSVLFVETQMARSRFDTLWPIWQHVHYEYMDNLNDSPPKPPVHIDS